MGGIVLGIGFIIVGLAGGLGVIFGWLRPIVQNERVTEAIGSFIAAIICVLGAIGFIIAGILKLAGVF